MGISKESKDLINDQIVDLQSEKQSIERQINQNQLTKERLINELKVVTDRIKNFQKDIDDNDPKKQ